MDCSNTTQAIISNYKSQELSTENNILSHQNIKGDIYDIVLKNIYSGGSVWFTIVGTSMVPFLVDGNKVLVRFEKVENLRCGDLVTYKTGNELITHRIIGIIDNRILTKGDYLSLPDKLMDKDSLIGKVIIIFRNNKNLNMEQGKFAVINLIIGYLQRVIGLFDLFLFNTFSSPLQRKIEIKLFNVIHIGIGLIERILIGG